jgi:hypothetical protein
MTSLGLASLPAGVAFGAGHSLEWRAPAASGPTPLSDSVAVVSTRFSGPRSALPM